MIYGGTNLGQDFNKISYGYKIYSVKNNEQHKNLKKKIEKGLFKKNTCMFGDDF